MFPQSLRRFRLAIALTVTAAVVLLLLSQPSIAALSTRGLPQATATISGPSISGKLSLIEIQPGLISVQVSLKGDPAVLTPGSHGIHFHETGICDSTTATRFSSAKGHFDPGPFGNTTPVEQNHPFHSGDLPNLQVNSKGQGFLQTVTTRANLKAGATSLLDSDGTAIIIHANLDQQKTGGTAAEAGGGRLACGILKAK
jgi:superoxide dismutase, Cu-Zn family